MIVLYLKGSSGTKFRIRGYLDEKDLHISEYYYKRVLELIQFEKLTSDDVDRLICGNRIIKIN